MNTLRFRRGYDEKNLGPNVFFPEGPFVDECPPPCALEFLHGREKQCLGGTNRGAHGLLSHTRAIITEIAFHHLIDLGEILGHAEGTREHAIGTSDATRNRSALNDPVGRFFDRVGRTNSRANRILAMHAHLRSRLHTVSATYRLQMDHRVTFVRIAFLTRLHARLAADTSRIVNKKRSLAHVALATRTAQILYSGIFETGSSAGMVHLFTAFSSGQ